MNRNLGIVSISFLILSCIVEARPGAFDITSFNTAGGNDVSQALLEAWKQACASPEPSSVVIPAGTFLASAVKFEGPCKAPIDLQIKGTLKAPEDHTLFKDDGWLTFHNVDRLTLSGGGIFDATGAKTWSLNECHKTISCDSFPISLFFNLVTNSVIQDITSKDSKFFHVNIIGSRNVTFQHITISAPGDSKNTDGIHIGRSTEINVLDSTIATGDDCVSLGDGSKQVKIEKVTCGPGHGISIGSLGKYPNEEPVEGVFVKNCTLIDTTNGVRIKTWPGSPDGVATDMHFEDIIVQNVQNPILIDQEYCPWNNCKQGQPSKIKISKVSFNNIKGTSALPLAVVLVCSTSIPCDGVEVGNVDLTYSGPQGPIATKCSNIKPIFTGTQNPPICTNSTQPTAPAP
ncbi:hypothetical protein M9H77_30988 [Catharanthus roseus]|uniref:Uncharacterized protein n=1 Tax=Catharanthus roseus TaxID=4058 RepID=A0ACB9ZZ76_CATRO|nr:hypothetical protein M9H77_30988 [Catharanthus roseus]